MGWFSWVGKAVKAVTAPVVKAVTTVTTTVAKVATTAVTEVTKVATATVTAVTAVATSVASAVTTGDVAKLGGAVDAVTDLAKTAVESVSTVVTDTVKHVTGGAADLAEQAIKTVETVTFDAVETALTAVGADANIVKAVDAAGDYLVNVANNAVATAEAATNAAAAGTTSYFIEHANFFVGAADAIGDAAVAAADKVVDGVAEIGTTVATAVSTGDLSTVVGDVITTVTHTLSDVAHVATDELADVADSFIEASENFLAVVDTQGMNTLHAATQLVDAVDDALAVVGADDILANPVSSVVDAVEILADGYQATFTYAANTLADNVETSLHIASDAIAQYGDYVADIAYDPEGALVALVTDPQAAVQELWDVVTNPLEDIVTNTAVGVGDMTVAVDMVVDYVTDAVVSIATDIDPDLGAFTSLATAYVDNSVDLFTDGVAVLADTVGDAAIIVSNSAISIASLDPGAVQDAAQQIVLQIDENIDEYIAGSLTNFAINMAEAADIATSLIENPDSYFGNATADWAADTVQNSIGIIESIDEIQAWVQDNFTDPVLNFLGYQESDVITA